MVSFATLILVIIFASIKPISGRSKKIKADAKSGDLQRINILSINRKADIGKNEKTIAKSEDDKILSIAAKLLPLMRVLL